MDQDWQCYNPATHSRAPLAARAVTSDTSPTFSYIVRIFQTSRVYFSLFNFHISLFEWQSKLLSDFGDALQSRRPDLNKNGLE